MRFDRRYLGVSGLLLGTTIPLSKILRRSYGPAASRSFRTGMAGMLLVQQILVGLAIRRPRDGSLHRLSMVDILTLSRGSAAALLVGLIVSRVRDRSGVAGWLGWLALLYGAILCDWLDGPLARHLGTSEVGAIFDMEADSWLTLCAAASAVSWGGLPVTVAVPPLVRYLLLFHALRHLHYGEVHIDEPRWVRPLGIVQMLLFIAALAPFAGRATGLAVRLVTPIQTPMQVAGLLTLHFRRS